MPFFFGGFGGNQEALKTFVETGEAAKAAEAAGRRDEAIREYESALRQARSIKHEGIDDVVNNFRTKLETLKKTSAKPGKAAARRPVKPPVPSRTVPRRSPRQDANPRPGKSPRSPQQEKSAAEELILHVDKDSARWEDIVGLDEVKQALTEMVILPAVNPKLFSGLRAPPKGLLLFGPPGNGKTYLAKAVAAQCQATFFACSASSLTSRWHGESEKLVKELFECAKSYAPSVVFMDEVDALLGQRGQNEHEASRRLKNELLIQLDGVSGSVDDGRVVVLAATNRPMDLDDAVLRRFPRRVFVPLPPPPMIKQVLKQLLRNAKTTLTDRDLDALASSLQNYSYSDITHLCREASLLVLRGIPSNKVASIRPENAPPITADHVRQALKNIRPSVAPGSVQALLEWNNRFGAV